MKNSVKKTRVAIKQAKIVKKADSNFWTKLQKPFFVLAPMANVTDFAFRQMITKYGKPDVMWTEFVSADGLMSPGQQKLLIDLKFSKNERPIVAQLFTGHPEVMKKAAMLIGELGFDGLDINMGCPDRTVEKQGGGASLMKNPRLALEVLEAARDGVRQNQNSKFKNENGSVKIENSKLIPVSIKTRLGYSKIDLDWIRLLLEQRLPALTIHLRTRKEMSDVPAHWEIMIKIIKMRNEISPETLIIGNGDVESLEMANETVRKYGCDGVMIGRGIFGKPWFFQRGPTSLKSLRGQISLRPANLEILLEHTKLFEKTFKGIKNFDVMKKHFKAYVSGFDGAKELRVELMNCKNAKEVATVIKGTKMEMRVE